MLSYGIVGNLVDEYMEMNESTWLESMYTSAKQLLQQSVENIWENQMLPA
jgi:hypothetical protein